MVNAGATQKIRIQVFSHGWHTGVVVAKSDLEKIKLDWLDEMNPVGTNYLEFGWGEEAAFRASHIGFKEIMRALFIPTKTVVHLERFKVSPYGHYPDSQLITLDVEPDQLRAMMAKVKATISVDKDGKLVSIGKGVEADSEFFRAKKYYFIGRSCNAWTSNVLRAGDIKVYSSFAPSLMKQIRKHQQR